MNYIEFNTLGDIYWYNSQRDRHRLDGPAVEHFFDCNVWYINHQHHRLDGPAVECVNGDKKWYVNGKLHRLDGPAVELDYGHKEWWIDNIQYPLSEFIQELAKLKEEQDS